MNKSSTRVLSVDVLRGLTILLMVFVNDLGQAAPAWMHHIQPPDADGMTLADIVFPFFLFIAGVSIPLSFHASRAKGHSNWKIIGHILSRSLALILMGLVEVNRQAVTSMNPDLWGLLAYTSIIFAWCVVPKEESAKRNVFIALKIIGSIGLAALLMIYRREPVATNVLFLGDVESWTWLQTQWWGILGLIGWAWLACAVIYCLVGHRREWLIASMALLMLNFLCDQNGGFFTRIEDKPWLEPILPVIGWIQSVVEFVNGYVHLGSQLGSLPATMMAGCVLGKLLSNESEVTTHHGRIRWALVFAAILFLAGAMTDTFAGINKISATPTFSLWCAALATVVWIGLYWLLDVQQWTSLAVPVAPAGENPLIAYLLHPIVLFSLSLTGLGGTIRAYSVSESSLITVAGSFAMAMFICGLTAMIAKAGLRLRV